MTVAFWAHLIWCALRLSLRFPAVTRRAQQLVPNPRPRQEFESYHRPTPHRRRLDLYGLSCSLVFGSRTKPCPAWFRTVTRHDSVSHGGGGGSSCVNEERDWAG